MLRISRSLQRTPFYRRRQYECAAVLHQSCYPFSSSTTISSSPSRPYTTSSTSSIPKPPFSFLAAAATAMMGTSAFLFLKSQCEEAETSSTATTTSTTTTTTASVSQQQQPQNMMLHRMRSLRGRSLTAKYVVDWSTVLGEGAYGAVHPARLRVTGEKVALKKITRAYTNATGFRAETDALLRIYDNGGHPNISGLRDMYQDHGHFYLLLDLVTGGEMFEHLVQAGAYSEADAARLVHEIASALAFLHGVGVVHCDLKPENLLLSTKNRLDGTIKMIDFGCATVVNEDEDNNGGSTCSTNSGTAADGKDGGKKKARPASTGTTAYWPPERFSKSAPTDPAVDMWSLGVILYIMLVGVHPFDVQGTASNAEIEATIQRNPTPPLDLSLVGHLSESAVDLILRLMDPNPATRLTAYEMLHHPWVQGKTALKQKMQDSDKKLLQFKDIRYKLEAGMFAVLVSQSHAGLRMSQDGGSSQPGPDFRSDSTSHILQQAFNVFDAEGKGFVTPNDLERVAKERTSSPDVSLQDTQQYVQAASQTSSSALSLSQFNQLFRGLHHKHFPAGHYIFHAGDRGDSMFFLSSGKVEIQTRKGQLVAILRSGDFFGEGSLLDDTRKRFTSAKCTTPVDVLAIRRHDFDRYVGASTQAKTDIQTKWRARSLAYAKNLLRLQKTVKVRTFQKGQVVYREGDIGTSMYRVVDTTGGTLHVSHGQNVVHRYTAGDSFGESSLLFKRPRSSTVTCASEQCQLYEMQGDDFIAMIEASPELAASLRDMARKRLFKKAVKQYCLEKKMGFSDQDIVAAFHDADVDGTGSLNLEEVRRIMHRMDPKFPLDEIKALLRFVDVDEDGQITLEEFKRLFRQFEDEKQPINSTAT